MAEIKIFGYTNKISVKQGEEIDFHVYADGTDVADANLVRLIHGDEHPDGPGFVEEEIDNDINGKWKVENGKWKVAQIQDQGGRPPPGINV